MINSIMIENEVKRMKRLGIKRIMYNGFEIELFEINNKARKEK